MTATNYDVANGVDENGFNWSDGETAEGDSRNDSFEDYGGSADSFLSSSDYGDPSDIPDYDGLNEAADVDPSVLEGFDSFALPQEADTSDPYESEYENVEEANFEAFDDIAVSDDGDYTPSYSGFDDGENVVKSGETHEKEADPYAYVQEGSADKANEPAPTANNVASENAPAKKSLNKKPLVVGLAAVAIVAAGFVTLNGLQTGTEQSSSMAPSLAQSEQEAFPNSLPNFGNQTSDTSSQMQLGAMNPIEPQEAAMPNVAMSQQQSLPTFDVPAVAVTDAATLGDLASISQNEAHSSFDLPPPITQASDAVEQYGHDAIGDTAMALPAATPIASNVSTGVASTSFGEGSEALQQVMDKMDILEERIASLSKEIESLKDFRNVASSAANKAADNLQTPVSDAFASSIPLKPAILEKFTLKGVVGQVAWVNNGSEVVEVKVGDDLSGAGRVSAIRQYAGQWLVVTSSGLIMR